MNSRVTDQISVSGNSLALCDVRCGPTEDKVIIEIAAGTYSLAVQVEEDSVCMTVCRSDALHPKRGAELGEVSIDGGVLGVYDSELFEVVFGADAEEFYEWGDALFETTDEIRIYGDKIEPFDFACVPTFADGVFRIVELLDGESRVGVSLGATMAINQNPGGFEEVEAGPDFSQRKTNCRYRIRLECLGVPKTLGPNAAREITIEFAKHRRRHSNAKCTWDGATLALQAENDFDPNGEALLDDFLDSVSAQVTEPVSIVVVSIDEF